MLQRDSIQLHFFEFTELNSLENFGQVYIRVSEIHLFYESLIAKNVAIHLNGRLEMKPWKQLEFAFLDPDNNQLTFGQSAND